MFKTTVFSALTLALVLPAGLAQAQGNEQLAAQLGVDPADYTTAELIQMKCIVDGDHSAAERARLLEGIKGYGTVSAAADAQAKEQLAKSVGVDPAEYTVEQLALLKSMIEDDQCDIIDPIEFVKGGERLTPESASAKAQLAEGLGVSPTEYTLSELVRMHFDRD